MDMNQPDGLICVIDDKQGCDLGMPPQLSNEKCIFLPDAIIHHKGSALSGRYSYFTMYHGFRNRTWTYLKNMPLPVLIPTLPGHIALAVYLLTKCRACRCESHA